MCCGNLYTVDDASLADNTKDNRLVSVVVVNFFTGSVFFTGNEFLIACAFCKCNDFSSSLKLCLSLVKEVLLALAEAVCIVNFAHAYNRSSVLRAIKELFLHFIEFGFIHFQSS